AVSDDLNSTVDYGAVARRIVEVGTKERVNLIERLAGLIAQTLLREFPAREGRVRVRKLTPPLQGLVGTPSVELVRSRGWRACSSRSAPPAAIAWRCCARRWRACARAGSTWSPPPRSTSRSPGSKSPARR